MTEAENQIRGAYDVAFARLKQTRETISAMRTQEHRILMQIRDCEAAARVFGFEFPPLIGEQMFLATGQENVREFTLAFLNQSPAGTKSREIKNAYEDHFQKNIHPKTIGMTLYRLKLDGLVEKIGGQVWRPAAAAQGG